MKNRPIRKIGNSWFIRLAQIDVKDYQLKEGDEIDLESALLLHTQNKNDCFSSSQPSHKSKKKYSNKQNEKKQ